MMKRISGNLLIICEYLALHTLGIKASFTLKLADVRQCDVCLKIRSLKNAYINEENIN